MCLIIAKGRDVAFPKSLASNAIDHNSDGVGLMWAEGGRVVVKRQTGRKEKQLKLLEKFDALNPGRETFVHFRYGTSGSRGVEMTHPFKVLDFTEDGRDLYVMHNGVLSPKTIKFYELNKSDTWHFVEHIRPYLKKNPDALYSQVFKDWMEKTLGKGNKMVFLEGSGRTITFNEGEGEWWAPECWISNSYSIREPFDWGDDYGSYTFGKPWTEPKNDNADSIWTKDQRGVYTPKYDFEADSNMTPEVVRQMSEAEVFEWVNSDPEAATQFIIDSVRYR